MIIAIIIVAILFLLSKQAPSQSSSAQNTGQQTIISTNPPPFTQGAITTGPSRESGLMQTWQAFQADLAALFAPNAFSPQASGNATSSSLQIQNQQLTDFTTVQPGNTPQTGPQAPPGGSSNTSGGGSGGGSSSSGTSASGGRGSQLFNSSGFTQNPIGAGPGVNTPVTMASTFKPVVRTVGAVK